MYLRHKQATFPRAAKGVTQVPSYLFLGIPFMALCARSRLALKKQSNYLYGSSSSQSRAMISSSYTFGLDDPNNRRTSAITYSGINSTAMVRY